MGYGYVVRIRLEENENPAVRMSEIREWLDRQPFDPARSQFHMTADRDSLTVDFSVLHEAYAFVEEFGGVVL